MDRDQGSPSLEERPTLRRLITTLLEEVHHGVEDALRAQARTAAERKRLLDLSLEEFANQYIDDEAVWDAICDSPQPRELKKRENEVRLHLAARERSLLEGLHRQGMPRILVETGTVTVPLRLACPATAGEADQGVVVDADDTSAVDRSAGGAIHSEKTGSTSSPARPQSSGRFDLVTAQLAAGRESAIAQLSLSFRTAYL